MLEALFLLSSLLGLTVGGIQLWKWFHRSRKASNLPAPPVQVQDKWVSLNYIEDAGLAAEMRNDGYELYWAAADREAELVDLKGWEVVIDQLPDGSRVRYKIHDLPSIGGFLLLLRRRVRPPEPQA